VGVGGNKGRNLDEGGKKKASKKDGGQSVLNDDFWGTSKVPKYNDQTGDPRLSKTPRG